MRACATAAPIMEEQPDSPLGFTHKVAASADWHMPANSAATAKAHMQSALKCFPNLRVFMEIPPDNRCFMVCIFFRCF
jgi:hypothetical protein